MRKRLSAALGAAVAALWMNSAPAFAGSTTPVGLTFHVAVGIEGDDYSLYFSTVEGATAGTWLATSVSGENVTTGKEINQLDWTLQEDNTFHGEGSGAGFSWALSSAGLGWVDDPIKIYRNDLNGYDACRDSNDFWCNTTITLDGWPTISAPEPSTWVLMGLGLAGLGLAGSRRAVHTAA